MQRSSKVLGITIFILLFLTLCIWYAAIREDRRGVLTVSFLDVGQGDSIFIDAPSGRQVLIDGGATASVVRELSKVMPWYDRSIDLVVATHPDADHVGGLIDVLARYSVSTFVQSSVRGDTATWSTLNESIDSEGARLVIGQRGQIIDLGGEVYLKVLAPDREVPDVETNLGCVITQLVYGSTSFMLTCDAPQQIEKYLVALDGNTLRSDVLKAGHHGSRTSSLPLFVGTVDPKWVVYSRGCDNKYGHPSKETIDTFARFDMPTLDTCTEGVITFVSDGETVRRK